MTSLEQWRDRLHLPTGRQQMTGAGMAFRAALLAIAAAAFLLGNNLLFLIVAAMFSTLLISGFVTRLGLAGLELDLLLPEHIPARRKVRAKIRLKNSKPWVPSFSIQLAGAAESGFNSILNFPVIRRQHDHRGIRNPVFSAPRGAAGAQLPVLDALPLRVRRAARDGHHAPRHRRVPVPGPAAGV